MPLISSAGTRRPSRIKTQRRRPVVPRARLTWLNPRATRHRRARRHMAARIGVRSLMRIRDSGHQLPLEIELVRAILLIALAVLSITLVLPALLELAAAPFR